MSDLLSGLPSTPGILESVGRFLMSSGWVAKEIGRVKYPAFLPAPDNATSVYRITGLEPKMLWEIADDLLSKRCEHGAAKIKVADLLKQNLDLLPEEPPLRHANISSWPTDADPQEQKRKRMLIAKALAEVSEHVPRNEAS